MTLSVFGKNFWKKFALGLVKVSRRKYVGVVLAIRVMSYFCGLVHMALDDLAEPSFRVRVHCLMF